MSWPAVFLLVLVGGVVPTSWRAAATPTNADDASAMQSIANSTGAAKSLGWGVRSPDPCGGTWPGVRCDGTGRVVSINASRGGLTGVLYPADLSLLASLTELDLSFNEVGGRLALPLLRGHPLAGLRTIDLRSTRFVDIPDGFFSAFPALETFAIDDNDMVNPMVMPDDVVTCSRLRSFSANNVNMYDAFPDFFGNASMFPDLESLSLARNKLWGVIDPEFGRNGKIKFLDVGAQRGHDDDGASELGGRVEFIQGMGNLVEVRVDHNSFFGPLPDATHLVNLRRVNAAANDLCGVPKFPAGIDVDLDGNTKVGSEC